MGDAFYTRSMRAGRINLPALGEERVYYAAIHRNGLAHNIVTRPRRKVDGHTRHVLVITDASRAGNYVVGETIAVDGGVVHAFLTESWEVDPSGAH